MSTLMIGTCMLLIVLAVLRKRLRLAFWSPVYVLIFVYLATFGLGAALSSVDGLDLLFQGATADNAVEILTDVVLLVTAFASGVMIMVPDSSDGKIQPGETTSVSINSIQAWQLLALAAAAAISSVLGTGLSNMWRTSIYLAAVDEGPLLQISSLLLWPSIVGLGVVAGQIQKSPKVAAVVLFGVLWLIVLAAASRKMAAFPVLFCIGMRIADSQSRRKKALLLGAVFLLPALQITAMESRALPTIGVMGLPGLITRMATEDPTLALEAYLINVESPVRVTFMAKNAPRADPLSYLTFALNPLPSLTSDSMVLERYAEERIAWYEPYNAIGEILAFGVGVGAIYFFVVGLVFGHAENRFRQNRRGAAAIVQTCLCIAFTVFSLQYSLRTVNRFVYYSLAIGVVGSFGRLKDGTQTHRKMLGPFAGPGTVNP